MNSIITSHPMAFEGTTVCTNTASTAYSVTSMVQGNTYHIK